MERKWKLLTPPRILVLGFTGLIALGTFLLMLPAAAAGDPLPFIDALFTATSAVCVTGLVVVDTGTYFTTFGQTVIMLLIQIGGLGFMTMATLFWIVFRRKISLKERLILTEAMNQNELSGIVRLIKKVMLYSILIELAGAALFTIRLSFDYGLREAAYLGVFHAVSLFNNAGFDIFGAYRSFTLYTGDPMMNAVAMCLIVLGGIGFVVMAEVTRVRSFRKLSLHSKMVLHATAALIVAGAVVIFIFEFTNPRTLQPLDAGSKALAALFQSVTTRTAGANSIDITGIRQATGFFMILLMCIGGSPGSTAGGIKTTTFVALIGALIAVVRGRDDVVFYEYRLSKDQVYKAVTLTLMALFLVIAVTMLLSATEDAAFLTILFEAASAFGTVGLSMGLTPELTTFGKVVIALTMFTGRVGVLTMAYALGPKKEKPLFQHPEGKIIIG